MASTKLILNYNKLTEKARLNVWINNLQARDPCFEPYTALTAQNESPTLYSTKVYIDTQRGGVCILGAVCWLHTKPVVN